MSSLNPLFQPPSLKLRDDTPDEDAAYNKLATMSPPSTTGPVVAIDLDDVLSQTNEEVANWHNEVYGTNMDTSQFYYYYYWKNPFWGTPAETFAKVNDFYSANRIHEAKTVPGAREGAQALRDMGYRLIIVTARSPDVAGKSWEWADIFDSVICTGQFKDADKTGHEVVTKLSKSQVCTELKACILIDDSLENAMQCATAKPPVPVLLFGDYQWNQRISGPNDALDEMTFDRRLKAEGGREFWKHENFDIPLDSLVRRVKDWGEVIRWVQSEREHGRM